jgi:soluble lytic murein transglycosylase-like protein
VTPAAYAPHLKAAAKKYGLDPVKVAAVVLQESSGDPSEMRLENGFYRKYVRPMGGKLTHHQPDTIPVELEALGRSTSWGLMQLMGQVARELGFAGESLADLKYPTVNLDLGCKYLRRLLDRAGGDWDKALLRWNGGGDPNYHKKVYRHVASGAAHRLLGEAKP